MSKRKQRKEEEKRILAELDEAVAAERAEKEGAEETSQEVLHCKRCKTKMQRGVCPTCGFTVYQPMAEEKRKKIRSVVTVCCVVGFLVLFFALRLWK